MRKQECHSALGSLDVMPSFQQDSYLGLGGMQAQTPFWVQWYTFRDVFNPLSLQGVQIDIESSSSVSLYSVSVLSLATSPDVLLMVLWKSFILIL